MFCHQMQRRTTGIDIFQRTSWFFHNRNCRVSDVWEKVLMVPLQWLTNTRTVARIREKVPNIETQCMIHREAIVAKRFGQPSSKVLSFVSKLQVGWNLAWGTCMPGRNFWPSHPTELVFPGKSFTQSEQKNSIHKEIWNMKNQNKW